MGGKAVAAVVGGGGGGWCNNVEFYYNTTITTVLRTVAEGWFDTPEAVAEHRHIVANEKLPIADGDGMP